MASSLRIRIGYGFKKLISAHLWASVDNVHAANVKRAQEAARKELQRRRKASFQQETATSTAILLSPSSDNSSDENIDSEMAENATAVATSSAGPGQAKRARRSSVNIVTPGLAAALDRTSMSSRQATYVLVGHDVASVNVNRMSIHQESERHQAQFVKEFKDKFSTDVPLVVYWDGKLMEDLTSKEHVDRLPMIITGEWICQLLGVPKIASGTGEA